MHTAIGVGTLRTTERQLRAGGRRLLKPKGRVGLGWWAPLCRKVEETTGF